MTRLVKNYGEYGLVPDPDTLTLALAADRYAEGVSGAEDLQGALVSHLDRLAIRSQLLSRTVRRWKEPPLADDMTCALAMVLDGVVRSPSLAQEGLRVSSEENYRLPDRSVRKPDVAIWRGSELVAIIECKTGLGYTRDTWMEHYEARVEEFVAAGLPEAAIIYVVASEQSWRGFPPEDPRTGTVWFSLARKGSWCGGGKAGEMSLTEGAFPGKLAGVIRGLESVLVRKVRVEDS